MYTLSCLDDILSEIMKLAAMETQTEHQRCCEIFFRIINRMGHNFVGEKAAIASPYKFNPILIKCDDYKGNRNGTEAVYGKEFLESRTSSCLYRFGKSVKNCEKV